MQLDATSPKALESTQIKQPLQCVCVCLCVCVCVCVCVCLCVHMCVYVYVCVSPLCLAWHVCGDWQPWRTRCWKTASCRSLIFLSSRLHCCRRLFLTGLLR